MLNEQKVAYFVKLCNSIEEFKLYTIEDLGKLENDLKLYCLNLLKSKDKSKEMQLKLCNAHFILGYCSKIDLTDCSKSDTEYKEIFENLLNKLHKLLPKGRRETICQKMDAFIIDLKLKLKLI